MAAIELTKAAFEALEREAWEQITAAIGDLASPEEARMRARLNACADVISAVQRAQSGWGLQDPREQDATRSVEFSPEALAFLAEQREATEGHIREIESSGEGDYEHVASEVFLLHVLNRVLGVNATGAGDSAALDRIAELVEEHKDWGQVDGDAFKELGQTVLATGRPVPAGVVA